MHVWCVIATVSWPLLWRHPVRQGGLPWEHLLLLLLRGPLPLGHVLLLLLLLRALPWVNLLLLLLLRGPLPLGHVLLLLLLWGPHVLLLLLRALPWGR